MPVYERLGAAVDVNVSYHVRRIEVLKEAAMNGRNLAIWIAIGIGVGAALGAALDNMGLWVALGVAGGAALGTALSWKKSS